MAVLKSTKLYRNVCATLVDLPLLVGGYLNCQNIVSQKPLTSLWSETNSCLNRKTKRMGNCCCFSSVEPIYFVKSNNEKFPRFRIPCVLGILFER